MQDKIKSFVYYGSEHYISLSSLRAMVPTAYLFLGFTGAVAGIAGNAPVLMAVFLSFIATYAIVVYTFHLWCPTPSFACRFAVSAFSALSLSVILQSWVFLILLVGRYIDIWDIVLIVALQIISSVIYFLITSKRIRKGSYKAEKSSKTNVSIAIISGASCAGMKIGRMLQEMHSALAATLVMVGFTYIAVLCSVSATMHIMKFCYCKQYGIQCGKDYETTSPRLFAEKKKKNSLPQKIWSVIWKVMLCILLLAILYGVYQVSRQPAV
ncbi:MAG: hypothetical protein IJB19_00310 [Clostridia bacterium]|nr:hypothetical protein [Clostridia bacterium]